MTDRSTSTTLGYVLTLSMATVLVTGLFVAGGNFVGDRQTQVIRQELQVIGQHVAANVEMADRLAVAGDDVRAVQLNQSFPEQVAGASYRVDIVAQPEPYVRLNSTEPAVSVEVDIDNTTSLGASSASGGQITVRYDESNDRLVIGDV
jgi:hypothetical protein